MNNILNELPFNENDSYENSIKHSDPTSNTDKIKLSELYNKVVDNYKTSMYYTFIIVLITIVLCIVIYGLEHKNSTNATAYMSGTIFV